MELLGPAGIVVSPLDAGQATAVLAAACNPDTVLPPAPGLAAPDEIITTPASPSDPYPSHNLGSATARAPARPLPASTGPTTGPDAEDSSRDWPHRWADEGDYATDDEVGQRGWTA